MTDTISDLIEQFIDAQLDAPEVKPLDDAVMGLTPAVQGTNHNIYHRRIDEPGFPRHKTPPRSIYFYYLALNPDGKVHVDHYFWPGGDPNYSSANSTEWDVIKNGVPGAGEVNLRDKIVELARNARADVGTRTLQPFGASFDRMRWRRRSWIVIFVDEPNWALFERQPGGAKPAIAFTSNATDPTVTSNESFFDADNFPISMASTGPGDTGDRTAIAMINHMKKNYDGDDNGPNDHPAYKFSIFFDVKFSVGSSVMKVIFDPGGENDGTPLNP